MLCVYFWRLSFKEIGMLLVWFFSFISRTKLFFFLRDTTNMMYWFLTIFFIRKVKRYLYFNDFFHKDTLFNFYNFIDKTISHRVHFFRIDWSKTNFKIKEYFSKYMNGHNIHLLIMSYIDINKYYSDLLISWGCI